MFNRIKNIVKFHVIEYLKSRKKRGIILHHSDTPNSNFKVNAKMIGSWHRDRGFREIGYHFVIKRDGKLEIGRALNKFGAHALGYNKDIGICLVGTGSATIKDNMICDASNGVKFLTEAQIITFNALLVDLKFRYDITHLLGHYQTYANVVKKSCPGFKVNGSLILERGL